MTKREIEKQEAREQLLKWIKPGDTVYTVCDHVSRSGMMRHIRIILLYSDDEGKVETLHPNYSVAKLLGMTQAKRDGLKVSGCGMDMGFHIVMNLGYALWPNGFGCIGKVGKGCPSNDHVNGDRSYAKHSKRHPHWHESSGYALRHRWL